MIQFGMSMTNKRAWSSETNTNLLNEINAGISADNGQREIKRYARVGALNFHGHHN